MRPDDRPVRLDPDLAVDGVDPELAGLAEALAAAGARARRAGPPGPTPAFAADLRTRLLAGLPAPAPFSGVVRPTITIGSTWDPGSLLPSRQALGLAMAAVLVVAVVGSGVSRLVVSDGQAAAVVAASGATLVRDGTESALAVGTTLRPGDTVVVSDDGSAVLTLARGETRLDGGAAIRIDDLTADRIALDQYAGRTWHRVSVPDSATYAVRTGPVEWTALGTAFDLSRSTGDDGSETVHGVGIQHDVRITGPSLVATMRAGQEATIVLRGEAPADQAIGPADRSDLDDPWILDNAERDVALGFDPGVLIAVAASPSPSLAAPPSGGPSIPAPSAEPTDEPGASPDASPDPEPSADRSPAATAKPTPEPEPEPTAKPEPTPSRKPTPDVGSLGLELRSCFGGIILDWTAWGGDRFDHYTAVRATSAFDPPTAYPPEPPVRALDATYTQKVDVTDGRDSGLVGGTRYWYRALAFSADDKVIATSPLRSAVAKGIKPLGGLIAATEGGTVSLEWTPLDGAEACFSFYKVVWSSTSDRPSYLGENDGAAALEGQSASETVIDGLEPGTYWFRVQAIRATSLGKFVVAQSGVRKVVVP